MDETLRLGLGFLLGKKGNGIKGKTMKEGHDAGDPAGAAGGGHQPRAGARPSARRKGRRLRHWLIGFAVIAIIAGIGRAMLPWAVRDYVNRTLDRNPLYAGK